MSSKRRPPVHTPQAGSPATKSAVETTQIVQLQGTAWSAPLPPPEVLQGYELIRPGTADRIMGWAESEGIHRRSLESRQQIINAILDGLGLVATSGLCAWIAWIGGALLGAGHDLGGFAALVGAMVPFGGAYIIARRRRKR